MTKDKSARIEFSDRTRQVLAERAAYFCSNPECRRLTLAPQGAGDGSFKVGIAAHIHAASPGGPRAISLRVKDIASVQNGIWLCGHCSLVIDKDPRAYPVGMLREWKTEHERFVRHLATVGLMRALSLPVKSDSAAVARRLVNAFEDRRVLYALYEREVPRYVADSVAYVRRELTRIREDAEPESPLDLAIAAVLGASRDLLDDIGPQSDERPAYGNPHGESARALFAKLGAFRKAVGYQLFLIVQTYGTPVSAELSRIMPDTGPEESQ